MAFLHWLPVLLYFTHAAASATNSSQVVLEIAYGKGSAVSVIKFRVEAFRQFHECLCNASNTGCLANYQFETEDQGFYVYETEFLDSMKEDQSPVTHNYYYSCRKMGLQRSLHCQRREFDDQVCGDDGVIGAHESFRLLQNASSSCGFSCVGVEWNSYQYNMRIHDYDNESLEIESCESRCTERQGTTTTHATVKEDGTTTDALATPAVGDSTVEPADEHRETDASTKSAVGDSTTQPTDEHSKTDDLTTVSEEKATKESSTELSVPTSSRSAVSTTSRITTTEIDETGTKVARLHDEGTLALIIAAAVLSFIVVIVIAIALIVWRKRASSPTNGKYYLQLENLSK